MLSQIIFCRLSERAKDFVGTYQSGFVEGKSTTDQIFLLRQILQKCREYQIPTHHLLIDFKGAYNRVAMEYHVQDGLFWEADQNGEINNGWTRYSVKISDNGKATSSGLKVQ